MLAWLLVVFFILQTISCTVNFPKSDDYNTIVEPIQKVLAAETFTGKIAPFFEQHTQHFQVVLRVSAYLFFCVFGYINFQMMMILGVCFLVPLFLLFQKISTDRVALLCAALLVCQPMYCEATLWATNAIPYLWIYPMVLYAFYLWRLGYVIFPVLLSALASITWANGLLSLALLLCFGVLQRDRKMILWSTVLLLFVMLLNHKNVAHSGEYLANGTKIILYTVRVIGSSFGFFRKTVATFGGAMILFTALFVTIRALLKERRDPLALFNLFLLGSALFCGLARQTEGPVSAFATSRYTLVSSLIAATSIMLFFQQYQLQYRRRLLVGILSALSIVFWIYSQLLFHPMMIQRRDLLRDTKLRWHLFREGVAGFPVFNQTHAVAEREGLIVSPDGSDVLLQEISEKEVVHQGMLRRQSPCKSRAEYKLQNDRYFHASGFAYCLDGSETGFTKRLVLIGEVMTYRFPVLERVRPDASYHQSMRMGLPLGSFLHSGYSVTLDKSHLEPGSYRAFIEFDTSKGTVRRFIESLNVVKSKNYN